MSLLSADSLDSMSDANQSTLTGDVCEICEQPGHDIFTCDLLRGSAAPAAYTMTKRSFAANDSRLIQRIMSV